MALKFFFGAEGASLAFEKLEDFADWDSSSYSADIGADWAADPVTFGDARVLDVTNISGVICVFNRSDPAATFDFQVRVGISSSNFVNVFFTPDGGEYLTVDDDISIGITTTGFNYICIVVNSVSAGTVAGELAPIQFQVVE